MFDAGLARQHRKTLALSLFPLDARLARVLHAEDAPRAGQCTAQCRLVIEIALKRCRRLGAPPPPPVRYRACASGRADGTRSPVAPVRPRRLNCLSLR